MSSGHFAAFFTLKIKFFIYFLIAVTVFALFTWLHMYRQPHDYLAQDDLAQLVYSNKPLSELKSDLATADITCFLAPYASWSDKNKVFISDDSRRYLDKRFSTIFGLDDHVWWIVGVDKNGGIVYLFRMDESLRPSFQGSECGKLKELRFIPQSRDGQNLFFIGRTEDL